MSVLQFSATFLFGILLGSAFSALFVLRRTRKNFDSVLRQAHEEAENARIDAVRAQTSLAIASEARQLEMDSRERHHAAILEAREQAFSAEKRAWDHAHQVLLRQFDESKLEMEKNAKIRLDLLREEFKTLSEKILSEKSGALQSANKQQIAALMEPVQQKMAEFRLSVEESKNKGIELNAELKTQLKKMIEETQRIGADANLLANALKGEQKTQGNWGEMILEDILARSGLREGIHYECQTTIRDVDGNSIRNEARKIMRPDIIVHYPDDKDVILDSKVSLSAYADYYNASAEPIRQEALARHLKSIRAHVDELAKKEYALHNKLAGRHTIDFVVMFIPNEAPYQLAMVADPLLWRDAFDRKVMIVCPSNLMALLQLIHIAWTRDDQNRNQQKILDTAAQMLDRAYAFYEQFDDVGKHLEDAQKSFDNATRRLKIGERHQSLVLSGEKLKALGVKLEKNRSLPTRIRPEEEGFPPAHSPESIPLPDPTPESISPL